MFQVRLLGIAGARIRFVPIFPLRRRLTANGFGIFTGAAWFVLVVAAAACFAQDAAEYKSREDLPAELRQKFDAGYEKYQQMRSELERERQRAALDDRLAYVHKRLAESREREQRANDLQADYSAYQQALRQKGQDAVQLFSEWRRELSRATQAKLVADCDADPQCRPFLALFSQRVIAEVVQRSAESRPLDWPLIGELFPENINELTADEALTIFTRWAERVRQTAEPESEALQRRLDVPYAVRDYLVNRQQANLAYLIFGPYLEAHSPKELEAAENRVVETHQALTELWPNWEQALKEGPYTEFPEAPPRPHTGPPPARVSRLWVLFVVNAVVLCAVIAWLYLRRARS